LFLHDHPLLMRRIPLLNGRDSLSAERQPRRSRRRLRVPLS
jgi:hypothetical protein